MKAEPLISFMTDITHEARGVWGFIKLYAHISSCITVYTYMYMAIRHFLKIYIT